MKQQYILYANTNPFPGYIYGWGLVDPDESPDGSTLHEYVQRKLSSNPDLRLHLRTSYLEITNAIKETKKFDPVNKVLVNQESGDITPTDKFELNASAKEQALLDNLPSWSEVATAVDNISSLANAKVFIKKLARVVYWLAKNTEE